MKADWYKRRRGEESSPLNTNDDISESTVLNLVRCVLARENEGSGISITYGYGEDDNIDVVKIRKKNTGESIKDEEVYQARINTLEEMVSVLQGLVQAQEDYKKTAKVECVEKLENDLGIYCKAGNVIVDGIVSLFKKWHISINEVEWVLDSVRQELGKVRV